MRKFGNYVFASVMLVLAMLTMARYRQISDFRSKSQEFVFVVSGDKSEISAAKTDLSKLTFQPVEEEMIEQGIYRLRVKCPPDKVRYISSILSAMKILRED